MVVYFSATGNTEYIAKELAERLNDECINLLDRFKTQDHSVLYSEKPFIICAPVYVCEMPRNYVANDAYPMLEEQEIRNIIRHSYNKLDSVASDIQAGRKLSARHIFLFETIVTLPFNPIWSKYKLRAKDFYCTDKCIGCGKCVKLCPLNNIRLEDKKPCWGDSCSHCMACIGNCPTEAIEYGTITQTKDKYNFGKYRSFADTLSSDNT